MKLEGANVIFVVFFRKIFLDLNKKTKKTKNKKVRKRFLKNVFFCLGREQFFEKKTTKKTLAPLQPHLALNWRLKAFTDAKPAPGI